MQRRQSEEGENRVLGCRETCVREWRTPETGAGCANLERGN
jgi:hypothetical protein